MQPSSKLELTKHFLQFKESKESRASEQGCVFDEYPAIKQHKLTLLQSQSRCLLPKAVSHDCFNPFWRIVIAARLPGSASLGMRAHKDYPFHTRQHSPSWPGHSRCPGKGSHRAVESHIKKSPKRGSLSRRCRF